MAFKGERLVIESLQVRGGKGDVAAALLAARELVALGHDGVITLVLSEEGLGILSRLVNAPLAAGEALPGESIVVHTLKSIPPGFKPADLYLAVARADAVFPKAALRVDRAPAAKGGARGVPINDQTIVAVVPVFGSTEQKTRDWTRTGLIQMGEQAFEMQAPGLSASHSGVYVDTVATQLRFKGPQERRSFILEAITGIDDPAKRAALEALYGGRALKGSELTPLYGVSHTLVKDQLRSYLGALARSAPNKSLTLVNYSAFEWSLVPQCADAKFIRIDPAQGQALPEVAEPGTIYVVEVGSVPHPVFVGSLALARGVPLVSGDGAMSAMISLAQPFALTKVFWNGQNIAEFCQRLLAEATAEQAEVLSRIFPLGQYERPSFNEVLELTEPDYRALFARTCDRLGSSTQAVVEAASQTRAALRGSGQAALTVDDPVLRASLLMRLLPKADPGVVEQAVAYLASRPAEAARLLADGFIAPEALNLSKLQEVFKRFLHGESDSERAAWMVACAVAPSQQTREALHDTGLPADEVWRLAEYFNHHYPALQNGAFADLCWNALTLEMRRQLRPDFSLSQAASEQLARRGLSDPDLEVQLRALDNVRFDDDLRREVVHLLGSATPRLVAAALKTLEGFIDYHPEAFEEVVDHLLSADLPAPPRAVLEKLLAGKRLLPESFSPDAAAFTRPLMRLADSERYRPFRTELLLTAFATAEGFHLSPEDAQDLVRKGLQHPEPRYQRYAARLERSMAKATAVQWA